MFESMTEVLSVIDKAARELPDWIILRDQIVWAKQFQPEHPNLPPLLEQLPQIEAEIARLEHLTQDWTPGTALAELHHMFHPVEPKQLRLNFWALP